MQQFIRCPLPLPTDTQKGIVSLLLLQCCSVLGLGCPFPLPIPIMERVTLPRLRLFSSAPMLAILSTAQQSFTAGYAPVSAPDLRAPAISMAMEGRRAALLGLGAAAFATPAFADSIEEIAARSNAAAKAAAAAKAEEVEEDKGNPALIVGGIVVGGTLASTAFYSQNLSRLGTKIASGGKDDGRGNKRR